MAAEHEQRDVVVPGAARRHAAINAADCLGLARDEGRTKSGDTRPGEVAVYEISRSTSSSATRRRSTAFSPGLCGLGREPARVGDLAAFLILRHPVAEVRLTDAMLTRVAAIDRPDDRTSATASALNSGENCRPFCPRAPFRQAQPGRSGVHYAGEAHFRPGVAGVIAHMCRTMF
jgi:hypothetical protein